MKNAKIIFTSTLTILITLIISSFYSPTTKAFSPCNINMVKEAESDVTKACSVIKELIQKKVGITDICMKENPDVFKVNERESKCYIWVHKIIEHGADAITVCHPVASGKKVSDLVQAKKLDFLHMLHKLAIKSKPMKGVWSEVYDFRGEKKSYLMKCNDEFYVGKTLMKE